MSYIKEMLFSVFTLVIYVKFKKITVVIYVENINKTKLNDFGVGIFLHKFDHKAFVVADACLLCFFPFPESIIC